MGLSQAVFFVGCVAVAGAASYRSVALSSTFGTHPLSWYNRRLHDRSDQMRTSTELDAAAE